MVDLTTAELATRLGVTQRHALALVSEGVIAARQLASGAWLADSDAVARYESSAPRGSGRTLDAGTAWGVLWELSGLEAAWLTARTRARVRARIRASSADELARAVAGRTRAHHYRAANPTLAAAGLISTGRSVAGRLGVGLMDDTRHVAGYVPAGTAEGYAQAHFMVAAPGGSDILFDNTLPVEFADAMMPPAVIAADLAVSTDTRERSGGLRAIEELRQAWLASN